MKKIIRLFSIIFILTVQFRSAAPATAITEVQRAEREEVVNERKWKQLKEKRSAPDQTD